MAKRRGNPNWGKPEPIGPVVPTVTSFEQVVKEFKLTPDQYVAPLGFASGAAGIRIRNTFPRRSWKRGDLRSSPPCRKKGLNRKAPPSGGACVLHSDLKPRLSEQSANPDSRRF